jgi:plastocyanin
VIGIVGSFGTNAFAPNPIQAAVGDLIVWTNNDLVPHIIVLDDGTMAGQVAPGQSTLPLPLTTPTATYRCTIHPTMVGTIGAELTTPTPPPPEPPEPPSPPGYYYDYSAR